MSRHLLPVCAAAAILFFSLQALALEPTLSGDADYSWSSVQGNTNGVPVVRSGSVLGGGQVLRDKHTDVPGWIVSEDFDGDGVYEAAVQFSEGTLKIVSLDNGRLRTLATARNMAPEASPLVLAVLDGKPTGGLVGIDDRGDLVSINFETGRTRRLSSGYSTLSHPLAADLDNDGTMEIVAVSDEGYLKVVKGRTQTRNDNSVELLPDTRITAADLDNDGIFEIAAFAKPKADFSPGRLGDELEAQGIAVFNWNGKTIDMEADLVLPDGQIFEMLTPIIATGHNGDPLLMLSVTEEGKGTQIRSYSYNKGRIKEKRKGSATDPDDWIHVLGSTAMEDEGKVYLLTALVSDGKDHDLELYRLDLAQKKITLRSAVSTHTGGSRLLETSLIGDFNNDGNMDLLAPVDGSTGLAIHSLARGRLKAAEIFTSSRKIGTNLCPGDYNGDGVSDLIFGLEDGTLVILLGE